MPASKADQALLETGLGGNLLSQPGKEQFDGRLFFNHLTFALDDGEISRRQMMELGHSCL
jgi:hypothetical protein